MRSYKDILKENNRKAYIRSLHSLGELLVREGEFDRDNISNLWRASYTLWRYNAFGEWAKFPVSITIKPGQSLFALEEKLGGILEIRNH